jgi:hypothetical protein
MEGDTTNFIFIQIADSAIVISTIARKQWVMN